MMFNALNIVPSQSYEADSGSCGHRWLCERVREEHVPLTAVYMMEIQENLIFA